MTLTEPTFDAFEQRLAAALTAEADTVTAADGGLERIHARIAQRRRTRRTTWFAAAAVAVLLAGIVGLALRPTTSDSAPYVDTSTDTGGLPDLPFLAPPNLGSGGMARLTEAPGLSYQLVQFTTTQGEKPLFLTVSVLPTVDTDPFVDAPGSLTKTSVQGRTAYSGTIGDEPMLWWQPTPGTLAHLTGLAGGVQDTDALTTTADSVRLVSEQEFWDALTSVEPGPDTPTAAPWRWVELDSPENAMTAHSVSRSETSQYLSDVPGDQEVLSISSGLGRFDALGPGDPDVIDVNGKLGRFRPAGPPDDAPMYLFWEPAPGAIIQVELRRDVTPERAVEIAAAIVPVPEEAWQHRMFDRTNLPPDATTVVTTPAAATNVGPVIVVSAP